MWYKTAKPLIESGKLSILGVVQEQHGERALLYKQWKQFDFPIIQDATTQLNLKVVPLPILIDEHGVVRNVRPRPSDLEKFIDQEFDDVLAEGRDVETRKVDNWIEKGNDFLHATGSSRQLDEAIAAFEQAIKLEPENGKALFSLGVARRMKFDSKHGQPEDFAQATELWSRALSIDPNQYIWRRRIQQYGPRLKKPYPFYDWVDDAIAEIRNRGEQPVQLRIGLAGSEIAAPRRKFSTNSTAANPDPDSKIVQIEPNRIQLTSSTIPATAKSGSVVRVYLNLKTTAGKFNHEAGPVLVWIGESSNGTPEKRLLEFSKKPTVASDDQIQIDFEFETDAHTSCSTIRGFALLHLCDDEGVCFYRRLDFEVDIPTQNYGN